jgi:hypothetical protein
VSGGAEKGGGSEGEGNGAGKDSENGEGRVNGLLGALGSVTGFLGQVLTPSRAAASPQLLDELCGLLLAASRQAVHSSGGLRLALRSGQALTSREWQRAKKRQRRGGAAQEPLEQIDLLSAKRLTRCLSAPPPRPKKQQTERTRESVTR